MQSDRLLTSLLCYLHCDGQKGEALRWSLRLKWILSMNERALTELSVTEAKHATVRAVDDGRDNVAEHRRCYVALNTITRDV